MARNRRAQVVWTLNHRMAFYEKAIDRTLKTGDPSDADYAGKRWAKLKQIRKAFPRRRWTA